jgi:hypothetical protein
MTGQGRLESAGKAQCGQRATDASGASRANRSSDAGSSFDGEVFEFEGLPVRGKEIAY